MQSAVVRSNVDTSKFDGAYTLDRQASFARFSRSAQAEADPTRRQQGEAVRQMMLDRFEDLRVRAGVIQAGKGLVQEFSLVEATLEGDTLRGQAVWHEDIGDPGDSSEIGIKLRLTGSTLEFATFESPGQPDDLLVYNKASGG